MARNESYDDFVEKFKLKKTTDDCYTPAKVYEAIKDWAIKEMNWGGRPIIRPFYPGGDYEHYAYPQGCVVIDNPPFSIISQIVKFYEEHKIDYFLFAPALTLFGSRKAKSRICTNVTVTYENGAKVCTSFLCSSGPLIRSAPDLYQVVVKADEENRRLQKRPTLPQYKYPDNVLTSSQVGLFSKYGIVYEENKGVFTRALDSQRKCKKSLFGSGYIVPLQAAKKAQEELKREQAERAITWELSEKELAELKNIEREEDANERR